MAALEQISLFGTLFIISAVVAGVALALAVFFFFYFDIPRVYTQLTGKGREATIRRIIEDSAKTGPTRKPTGLTGQMGAHTSNMSMVVHPAPAAAPPAMETAVLVQETADETSLLTQEDSGATAVLHAPAVPDGYFFQITENTLVIHTDELI